MQVVLKHMKRLSIYLMVREIQIKITLRHKFSVRLAKPQKVHAIEFCLGCREMGTLIIACGNAKWNDFHGEDLTISGKITHGYTFSPSIPTSRKLSQRYIGKNMKRQHPCFVIISKTEYNLCVYS